MNHPRYPEYKDSGVNWLGLVPSHWVVTALKHGYSVTLGKMLQPDAASEDDALLPYLRAANIQWAGVDCTDVKSMWFSKRDREQLRLEAGDLLVSEGGDVGRSAIWTGDIEECYFQNSVNRVRPLAGNLTTFLAYWMSTMKDKGFIDVLCNKSTIAHFTAEKVGSVPVPFPPRGEQLAIAAFLDRETAKIDALVEEQKRLIELLKEKRQAVISQAVTKGLDPNVPMKDSGVAWLGKVPTHWGGLTIAKVSTKITNGFVGPTRDILVKDGVPYVQATHIKGGRVLFDGAYFVTEEWSRSHQKSILREGDVLIVQTGAGTGDVGLVWSSEAGYNCHALIIVSPDRDFVIGPYLAAVLQSTYGRSMLSSIQTGAMHPHLNCGEVKFIPIPIPSIEEQHGIVNYLLEANRQLGELIAEATTGIFLLEERRSALISAAVTGKIDVRGLALQPEGAAA